MKRSIKIVIDILMFVLFLYLMGYQAGRSSLYSHGVLGATLFMLFVLHHLLNLSWYRALTKGNYPFVRKLFIAIDFLFLADMIVMAASSIMLAEMIFPISLVHPSQLGRTLHVASTAWGFFLMALHVGLHTHGALFRLERKLNKFPLCYCVIYCVLICGAIAACVHSKIWGKMLLLVQWQEMYSYVLFYAEYLVMVAGLCVLVHLIMRTSAYMALRART